MCRNKCHDVEGLEISVMCGRGILMCGRGILLMWEGHPLDVGGSEITVIIHLNLFIQHLLQSDSFLFTNINSLPGRVKIVS